MPLLKFQPSYKNIPYYGQFFLVAEVRLFIHDWLKFSIRFRATSRHQTYNGPPVPPMEQTGASPRYNTRLHACYISDRFVQHVDIREDWFKEFGSNQCPECEEVILTTDNSKCSWPLEKS